MTGEFAIATYVVVGVGTALAVGFSLPALTEPGPESTQRLEVDDVVQIERSYCQANVSNVNCVCFGRTSGYIISQQSEKVYGAKYADKAKLARTQARRRC